MYKKNKTYWFDWNRWDLLKKKINTYLLKDKKIKLFFIKVKLAKAQRVRNLRRSWVIKRLDLNITRKVYSNKNKYLVYKNLMYNIIFVQKNNLFKTKNTRIKT